jgi:hypothetical protein
MIRTKRLNSNDLATIMLECSDLDYYFILHGKYYTVVLDAYKTGLKEPDVDFFMMDCYGG